MLDMGFLPDLQRIINLLPKKRQNLMFSATFSPEIKKLAASFLTDPLTIEVARSNATNTSITQVLYKVQEEQKRDVVEHLIRSRALKQVLVFSNTKIGASRLARYLPYNAEDYVHRIGRTGRAGATGDALSVYSEKDERLLVDIEKLIKQTITRGELTGFAPGRASGSERPSDRRSLGRRESDGSRSFERSDRAERSERGPRGPGAPRREKIDPWFLKPYEPAAAPRKDPAEAVPVAQAKPKQKLAALLGGLPKQ
jgi:superfamily II DNA/RNA helicase